MWKSFWLTCTKTFTYLIFNISDRKMCSKNALPQNLIYVIRRLLSTSRCLLQLLCATRLTEHCQMIFVWYFALSPFSPIYSLSVFFVLELTLINLWWSRSVICGFRVYEQIVDMWSGGISTSFWPKMAIWRASSLIHSPGVSVRLETYVHGVYNSLCSYVRTHAWEHENITADRHNWIIQTIANRVVASISEGEVCFLRCIKCTSE